MPLVVDIEVTNRCNADCHFCPRDQTPHEGLMTDAIFEQALARVLENRDSADAGSSNGTDLQVSLCGLGEPLVNPRTAAWASEVTRQGIPCGVTSNGALLDERRGAALIEAGVDQVWLNVGAIGEEYEKVYKLPWARTRDNVVRFAEMAQGSGTAVRLALVNYREDPAFTDELKAFWRERGIDNFIEWDIMNRGGSLFVDHMQFETLPQNREARRLIDERGGHPICAQPFLSIFIGYDGHYYLCCSDWKKEVSFGTVFERSIVDTVRGRLEELLTSGKVCRTCNIDPVNQLTEDIRAAEEGGLPGFDASRRADEIVETSRTIVRVAESMVPGVTEDLPTPRVKRRRRIPVFPR
jgi:MoaA/NifB/PqqE/SkfB family radical SAM enzyme